MALKIQDGETVLFIGDSITDCGRSGSERPLGNGYVKLFADLATIREPARRIRVINKGIGGHKVTDLRARWEDDVLRHKPDWLSVKIGINDLHRTLFYPPDAVPPDIFQKVYDEVLSLTAKRLPKCRLLLVDPFYISTDSRPGSARGQVLALLPDYLRVVHMMSRRYKTRLAKTHEMFQKLLEHHEPDTFCGEPVHPNLTGHLAIAETVYGALSK